MAQETKAKPVMDAMRELPTDRLTHELRNLAQAMAERSLISLTKRVEGATGRLTDYAEGTGSGLVSTLTGDGGSVAQGAVKGGLKGGLKGAIKGAFGGLFKRGKKDKSKKLKLTNIVETIDIGAPVRVVYNQWTQFQDFPSFMKKVETVEQASDDKLRWKAQVFWSHRTWESQIVEQVPDHRIIWRSKGNKGHVDGSVTFHEIAPDLTRVMLVLEYHPQGLMERTGNMWRAQGRRARLELKHFARHVVTATMLHPDEMEKGGWRGEIHDSKVVKDHETGLREEQAEERAEEEEKPEAAAEAEEPEEEAEEEPEEEEEEEEEPAEKAELEEEEPEEEAEEEEGEEEEGEEEEEPEEEEPEEEEPEEEAGPEEEAEEEEAEEEKAVRERPQAERPQRERAERPQRERAERPARPVHAEEPASRPVRRRPAARRA